VKAPTSERSLAEYAEKPFRKLPRIDRWSAPREKGKGGGSLVRVCPAIKANGERCKGIVGAVSHYCPAHDPAREGARRRAASKAARSKPEAQLKGVRTGSSIPSPTACCPVIWPGGCAGGLAGPKRQGVKRTS